MLLNSINEIGSSGRSASRTCESSEGGVGEFAREGETSSSTGTHGGAKLSVNQMNRFKTEAFLGVLVLKGILWLHRGSMVNRTTEAFPRISFACFVT